MRRRGELSISEAANRIEVHERTMRRWAQNARSGFNSRLNNVRIDAVGRYWIPEQEVMQIAENTAEENTHVSGCLTSTIRKIA